MNYLLKYKSLFKFITLNYIDKAIGFSLPLLVLFVVKEITLYNNIEYIYSIANVGVILVELGGRNYMLYAYSKESPEKRSVFLEHIKNYFSLLFLIYLLILIFFVPLVEIKLVSLFIPFIGVRILVLLFTNYYSIYYRLVDKPQNILYYSIVINLLTITAIIIGYKLIDNQYNLYLYFCIQILFILLFTIFSVKKVKAISIKFSWLYLKKSIIFSWPIMLNILLATFINNFGKIYIFNEFSEDDMYTFSYLLRIAMVVQMAHMSIVAYYSKKLFLDQSNKIDKKLHRFYTLFLLASVGLSILVVILINSLNIIKPIEFGYIAIFLFMYVFLWCQQAFLEQYLNKLNRNKWILFISCVNVLVYLSMIFLPVKKISIEYIAFCMLVSTSVALIILVSLFKYKKLI